MTTSEKVAAVVITLNEEELLQTCLSSVEWMDEIIVVDSGSTDQTLSIARRYTDSVYRRRFDDYASQKNYGAEQTDADWVFSIDADEVVTSGLKVDIESVLTGKSDKDAYSVPRDNVYFGRPVRHVFGTDEPVRLYRPGVCRYEGVVDEKITCKNPGRLSGKLIHRSCRTHRQWVVKHRSYVRRDAARAFVDGRRFSWRRVLLSPLRVFLLRYGALRGWKDGWAGLAIAFEMAVSTGLYEKELRRLASSRSTE
jgi:glycosyltransferase involved in cell wall biosynthesis